MSDQHGTESRPGFPPGRLPAARTRLERTDAMRHTAAPATVAHPHQIIPTAGPGGYVCGTCLLPIVPVHDWQHSSERADMPALLPGSGQP